MPGLPSKDRLNFAPDTASAPEPFLLEHLASFHSLYTAVSRTGRTTSTFTSAVEMRGHVSYPHVTPPLSVLGPTRRTADASRTETSSSLLFKTHR